MDTLYFITVALAGVAIIAVVGRREHLAVRAARRGLFDLSATALEHPHISHGGDDFPRLDGRYRGRAVRAELISDTMTIRRLPQLWLSLTVMEPHPGLAELAVLARPNGAEFYSLTEKFSDRLDPPPGLPHDVLVRGRGQAAQSMLSSLGGVIGHILRDERVKEVGITAKGLRLVWQAGEGRRGDHLLLRQCNFDDATVRGETLQSLLLRLDELSSEIARFTEMNAA